MNVERKTESVKRRQNMIVTQKCYRLDELPTHFLRAVIGIMGRIAGLSHVMRITIAGIRIRISAVSCLQIQDVLSTYSNSSNFSNILRKLLAELINPVERQNTQRRRRLISTDIYRESQLFQKYTT